MNEARNAAVRARRDGAAGGAPGWPRPARPRLPGWLAYRIQPLLAPNAAYRRLARWLESSRLRYRPFTAAESAAKGALFGCRMCGQCTLDVTGYACPMSCPKQLRNGPCGGVAADGSCEVYPGVRCVWLTAYDRAARQHRLDDLSLLQRPVDHRGWGDSSWVNYWSGRDDGLAVPAGGGDVPGIWRPGAWPHSAAARRG
jgi:methylene-tetrahydrofolate reductase-like protein